MRATFLNVIGLTAISSVLALSLLSVSRAQYDSQSGNPSIDQGTNQIQDQSASPSFDQNMGQVQDQAAPSSDQGALQQDHGAVAQGNSSDEEQSELQGAKENEQAEESIMQPKAQQPMAQCNCPTSTDLNDKDIASVAPGDSAGQIRELTIAVRGLNTKLAALEKQEGLVFDPETDSFVAVGGGSRVLARGRDRDDLVFKSDNDRDDIAFVPRHVARAKQAGAPAKSHKAVAGKSGAKASAGKKAASNKLINQKLVAGSTSSQDQSKSSATTKPGGTTSGQTSGSLYRWHMGHHQKRHFGFRMS